MDFKLAVFPFKAKLFGLILIILALPCAYLYFWGGKPEIFNIKIFALVTTYLKTRYFVVSQTNILDELAAVFFLLGLSLISFSKEKSEQENFEALRIKALIQSLFITLIFWITSFLLVYGMAIFIVSFVVFVIFLVLYNVLFRIHLVRYKNKAQRH